MIGSKVRVAPSWCFSVCRHQPGDPDARTEERGYGTANLKSSVEPQRARAVFRRKLATAATAVLFVVGCGSANDADRPEKTGGPEETTAASTVARTGPPEGTKSFQNLGRDHLRKPVDYAQAPPVGGDHAPIWQNCGFYSEPVRNETAVHSMEHGAVWITYRPGLSAGQLDRLRGLTSGETHVLVSPYPDLPNPVVASAWGKQLRLDSAQDPRLEQFVRVFRQGPQTPEAGAPCTGGRSKAQPGHAGAHE